MYRFKPLDNLAEKVPRLLLAEAATKLPEVVEVAAVAVLHKQIKIVHRLLNIVKAYDIRTANPGENAYLTLQILL